MMKELFPELESIRIGKPSDDVDWTVMSLETFQKDWDNTEDAIYDNWRELYDVPVR